MRIVVLDGLTLNPGDNSWQAVESLGEVTVYDRTSKDQILQRSAGAQILLTNKTPLDADCLAQLNSLQMISVLATGYNVVDVEQAKKQGVPVCNVPVYGTHSVAQHVFATLLSFIHRPFEHDRAIRDGKWNECQDFSFCLQPIHELNGKVLGIVGYGRIGAQVAKLADAFGMKIRCHTRSPKPDPGFSDFGFCDLEEVFSESDFISLNCPQTPENTGFVCEKLIDRMKPTAILINASRGGLINESDLANALNQGRIRGAILDVVSVEPIEETNPLFKAKNCLLTPHYAWAAVEARRRLMQTTAENIQAFISGSPINVVNR